MDTDLNLVLDALPGMVWTASSDGHIDFVNRRWTEYTGLPPDEAHGWDWQSAVDVDDLPNLLDRWRSILASGQSGEMEARVRRFDGQYRWFLIHTRPLSDEAGRIVRWYGINTDIDDRKRIEEALRESERAARSTVDGIPGLVAVFTPDGRLERVNRQVLAFYGKTLEELQGWEGGDFTHPDDLDRAIAVFTRSLATGEPFEIEVRARRFDGIYRWFESRGFPLRDASGHVQRWYNLLIDIDERKLAEDALRASETNLRLIIDSIPGMVCTMNAAGVVELLSRQVLDYFGKTSEELINWQLTDAVHPDDLPPVIAAFTHSVTTGDPYEMEHRCRRFDGVYRWFQVRALPVRDADGGITGWYVVLVDIDDRKRAEDALRRSEAFLAEGQRLSLTGNFSWRLEPDEILFSEELCRIFGFEPGAAVTLERVAGRVHPDDLPLFAETIGRARAGIGDLEYEIRLQMPDRSVRYLRTIARGSLRQDGRLEYLGAVQDVTERKLSDEALGTLRSELAHVARVTSLGAMTASIAHEVNQPLAGIITNAGTCLRMLAADPPNIEGARETARRTIRDGNRAADVIARLRALFSKQPTASEPVDLNEAAREVIALSWGDLHRSRIALSTEFDDDLPPVVGDRVQLQQVIMNLLRNAADAMQGIEGHPRLIVIRTEADPVDHVRLSVRDSGVGFAPHGKERVFEPFFTTKSDGMGIGLSVSRTIIESHQGRLWASENEGPGATFSFALPAYSADGPPAPPDGVALPAAGNDQRPAGKS